jgi:hypothetical protein
MGLDGVEILVQVEDTFDIRIEDADAEQMRTPGDFIESVWSKVAQADSTACLTRRALTCCAKPCCADSP